MKHQHLFGRAALGIALVAILAAPGRAAFAAGGPTPPATGRVHYTMTGSMVNGSMTMAWIAHGKKFRQEMKMLLPGGAGHGGTMDAWTVGDGTCVYSHPAMLGNTVMRVRLPKNGATGGAMGMGGMMPGTGNAGKVIGKGTILGHSCHIHSMPTGSRVQGKVWLWNGMPLKVETEMPNGGSMTMVATRVETDPHLDPSDFKVPAGYEIKDFQLPAGALGGSPTGAH